MREKEPPIFDDLERQLYAFLLSGSRFPLLSFVQMRDVFFCIEDDGGAARPFRISLPFAV
jgi:hypothetical protein